MKFFYTATVLAAAMLASSASAQSLKATSTQSPSSTQLSTKAPAPEGRLAIMAAKGIDRMPVLEGANAARGGVGNDDCATAQAITMISLNDCATNATVGNNAGASNGPEVPSCDGASDAGFQDVWYTFNSGTYTIANLTLTPNDPSTQDWGFVVYDACGGAEIACDIAPSGPQQVTVMPGMDYYIRVFSNLDWGTGGPFTLCVASPAAAPANDGCVSTADALAVGSPITFTGTTVGATNTGDFVPGSALDGEAPTVWHAFTTTECTNVTISYCGTDPAFGNAWIFLAPSCPAGDDYILTSSNNFTTCADGNITLIYLNLPAGTYHLPVMYDGADANGPYTIQVSAAACAATPVNDGCASSPVALAAGSAVNFTGTTAGATNTGDFVAGSDLDGESATVWHSFTTTECTNVTVSYCGTTPAFGNIWVFLAPSCPAGNDYIIAASYESSSCSDGNFTLVYTYLPAGTYYLPVMFDASDANGPYTIDVSAEACAPGYCIPMSTYGPTDGDFIANVTLGAINNSTGGVNTYEDYTAQSTVLTQGTSYTLSITSGDYGIDVYAAWIDYNVDTTFQASEKLGEVAATSPGQVVSLPFTVPANATVGTTRLRVRGSYGATNMDPCGNYNYGEVEDYSVDIQLGSGVAEYQASNLAIYPNPTSGDITISAADLNGNVEFELMDMTGRVVYRHQQTMSANQPVTLALNGKLAQGTYTLRLISANGISSRPVMVK